MCSAAGAVWPVRGAASVALVHLWAFQPLVFDDCLARCKGFVGAAECVLYQFVLTVDCGRVQVWSQQ